MPLLLKLLGRDDEMTTNILICDDLKEGCEEASSKLDESSCQIDTLYGDDLKGVLKELFETETMPDQLSEVDIAVVDNNLADLDFDGAQLTAEGIIGRLRAFTDINYIISLNKKPNVDFDLRHLFGDHDSISDLALNTRHLSCRRLWTQPSGGEFAPWYWPQLPGAAARRSKQVDFVRKDVNARIWDVLSFPPSAMDNLSRRAKGALNPEIEANRAIQEITFSNFFEVSRSLPYEMRQRLKNLSDEGDESAMDRVARVVAAELDRWLRKEILVLQDVLIDLPHLLSRLPILLGQSIDNLSAWNAVVAPSKPPYGLNWELYDQHVKGAEFQVGEWVPSPCFWWPELKADDELLRLFFDSEDNWPDAVFCEDISMFLMAGPPDDERAPVEFVPDIEGSWPRRYVAMKADFNYSPLSYIDP